MLTTACTAGNQTVDHRPAHSPQTAASHPAPPSRPPPSPAVNGLTKSALEAIRASMVLEEVLLEECREAGAACPAPWGTMERLSPLLYTWAQVGKCCILLL